MFDAPATVLFLALLLDPRAADLVLTDRYQHLPSEAFCEFAYHAAERDCQELCAQQWIVGGWSGGRLRDAELESCRLRQAYFAAWWVRWHKATREQQDEWAEILAGLVGPEQFWRGEIPLPLSLRSLR